jgi:pyridoxal phosphate enzyme (YggS family)
MSIELKQPLVTDEFITPTAPTEPAGTEVKRNLNAVLERMVAAARRAGRDPSLVRLVAVTKTFPPERILAAYQAGVRDIGENRIEEARDKVSTVTAQVGTSDPIRWHLIGHLQRRKAREAVQLFDLIQSVDSVKLAQTLDRHAEALGKQMAILLQVNVARDPHKFGFLAEPRSEFLNAVAQISGLGHLRVQGLMTIGPLVASAEQARPFFRGLRELRDEVAQHHPEAVWRELSMGMTDDFTVAIAEGATIVRIGRAIFGERS